MSFKSPTPEENAMAIKRIQEITIGLMLYKDRKIKLRPTKEFASGEDWYSYLINEWIIVQPDMETLMTLFILLNFAPLPFVELVVKKSLDRTLAHWAPQETPS